MIFVWKHTEKHSDPRDTQISGSFAEEKGFGLHTSKACAEGAGVGWMLPAHLGKMILNHGIWMDLVPYFRQTYFQNWDDDTQS